MTRFSVKVKIRECNAMFIRTIVYDCILLAIAGMYVWMDGWMIDADQPKN